MNVKPIEISNYLPEVVRFSGVALWGAALFFLLSAPFASAKEHGNHDHDSLVLMTPNDLPADARAPGEDMYLYEGNARTYLYVEQDGGKRLLVLDVSDPNKISEVSDAQISTDVPFDFAGPVDGASVLIRFRTKSGEPSEWGRIQLNRPASPRLVTWDQSAGDIVDPLNNRTFDVEISLLPNHSATGSFQIVDVSRSEPPSLATIPGVKKILTDPEQGHKFYLASNGVWVLRNLAVERNRQIELSQTN